MHLELHSFLDRGSKYSTSPFCERVHVLTTELLKLTVMPKKALIHKTIKCKIQTVKTNTSITSWCHRRIHLDLNGLLPDPHDRCLIG